MSNLIKRDEGSAPPQSQYVYPAGRLIPGVRDSDEEGLDLQFYFNILWKHRLLIFSVIFVVVTLVAVETFSKTPLYVATATVQVDPEAPQVLPYREVYEPVGDYRSAEAYLRTQHQIMTSRSLARRVVQKLNLAEDPAFNTPISGGIISDTALSLIGRLGATAGRLSARLIGSRSRPVLQSESVDPDDLNVDPATEEAVDVLLANLAVSPDEISRLVHVSYWSPEAGLTARIVNTLAEEFIEYNFESKFHTTTMATNFLRGQLQELRESVERSEEALIRYARENNILNVDESDNIVSQRLSQLNQQFGTVEIDLIAKSAQYQAVQDATVENFPQSLKNATILELENRLFALEQQLASLSARFGSEWPDVIQAQGEIEEVKRQIVREKEDTIRRARLDYEVARNHYQKLSHALDEQKRVANRLNEDLIQYNLLKREVDTNKQLHEGLLQRLKEAAVSAGLKSSNIRIVDRGIIPLETAPSGGAATLALSFFLSLALGVGLAFLLEYSDRSVRSPEEVEQILHLPSLGFVPSFQQLPLGGAGKLVVESSEDHPETGILVPQTPLQERHWESYRQLRTALLLSHSGKPPQKILISSALPEEGKTTTAANLAIALAQTGARTLVLDLDMRQPALAKKLGVNGNGGQGMSVYLSGNSDLASQIKETVYPNLFLLPAGVRPPNPAELIGSERMSMGMKLLSQYFKFIVIDSAPLLGFTDSLVLSTMSDGVVLVVGGGKTPRQAVKRARAQLDGVGAKILGVVLNNVDVSQSGYGNYYGMYGKYRGYYEDNISA